MEISRDLLLILHFIAMAGLLALVTGLGLAAI